MKVFIDDHLEDLHQRRENADKSDKIEKAQIDPFDQSVLFQQMIVNQVVYRRRYRQQRCYRHAETKCDIDFFRDSEKSTHAEEKIKRHILDKNRADKNIEVRFEQDNLHVVELFLNHAKLSGETGNNDSVLPSRSPFNFLSFDKAGQPPLLALSALEKRVRKHLNKFNNRHRF